MIKEWQKAWWLGGDLNTRPRDYDFYAGICHIVSKTANFLAFRARTQFPLQDICTEFLTRKSAQQRTSKLTVGITICHM